MTAPVQSLVRRIMEGVLEKDFAVQLLARGAGAAPVHELEFLVRNPDPVVRELAVYCLRETGDPSAVKGLVEAVLDPNVQVARTAARALYGFAGPSVVPSLLSAFDDVAEPKLRRELALVLGPIADPDELRAMKQRWETEGSDAAKEGLTIALAGRGDGDAQKEFEQRLLASTGRDERLRWLENAERVGDRWLLPALGQILRDRSPVLRVAVDELPDPTESLRACDLALNLIAKITRAKFSFPVTGDQNYTDAQLQEALRIAKASSPSTP
jgi:HEAT repeat protein